MKLLYGCLLALLLPGCQPGLKPSEATHTPQQDAGLYAHMLYRPAGHNQKNDWPLLLFLHGSGERGSNLEAVTKHGPPKRINAGKSYPCVVVSPQCPANERWEPVQLLKLIDHIAAREKIDPKRLYVTGLSMGGFGTWNLLAAAPDRFAAAVPICGGGDPATAENFSRVPVWCFHGDQDKAVSVDKSRQMIEALEKAGAKNVKLTIYPGVGHDSWTQTYDNPEMDKWLFQQKLP